MSLSVSLIFAQFRYIKELFLFTLKIIEEALEVKLEKDEHQLMTFFAFELFINKLGMIKSVISFLKLFKTVKEIILK